MCRLRVQEQFVEHLNVKPVESAHVDTHADRGKQALSFPAADAAGVAEDAVGPPDFVIEVIATEFLHK